jgi:hypothetical protein
LDIVDREQNRLQARKLAQEGNDSGADSAAFQRQDLGMVHGLRTMLVEAGVDEDDIRTEEFTGY